MDLESGNSPEERMMRLHLMGGPWINQTLYVAASLGLADRLGDTPTPIAELAASCECDEDALYRFCRALAGLGVLRAHPGRAFTLTAMGEVLRTDTPRTLRWGAMLHGGETFRAWADVLHTVRTGRPAFEHTFGQSFFDYLDTHPKYNDIFNKTMGVTDRPPEVLAEYDFTRSRVVADLGGGIGTLLATVLDRYPHLRGILLDLPAGIRGAEEKLAEYKVADRCEVVGASFFDVVPAEADTYILSRVLHNWNDERALALLTKVREQMEPGQRLLVIDHFLPPTDDGFHPGLLADLQMLVVLGGKDRTEQELGDLLTRAGFRVGGRWEGPVDAGARVDSMLEAVAVDG